MRNCRFYLIVSILIAQCGFSDGQTLSYYNPYADYMSAPH